MNDPDLPSRYTLLQSIGEGGEGRVFRVHDSLRQSEVALKLAPSRLATWLRREFDTLRQIQHEHLIRVFDWGLTEKSEVFYTMELVVGGDWGGRMGTPQSPDEARRIVSGVLRGLAHLHSHREIHGDIKPGNVLLGRSGTIKLTDVGMGSAPNGDLLSGTPGYAAPELWHGSRPSIRADIYSVGVMAYEALTGKHPFMGKTVREVVSGQLAGWVPSPAAHGIRLPVDLEREIMRAIDRDPALRPASADEFMEGLGESQRTSGILGGKFVARTSELTRLEELLDSDEPGSPTLVWVNGEGGIGKSALIDEVASRAIARGARVTRVSDLTEVGSFRNPLSPTFAETEALCATLGSKQTVLVFDAPADTSPATFEAVRALGRYLHAMSAEARRRITVTMLYETHQEQTCAGTFETAITLTSLDEREVGAFLEGFLGTVSVQPQVVEWLASVTGGVPGHLAATVDELIRQGVLRRHQGHWSFAEVSALPSIERVLHRSKWSKSLEGLDPAEQSLVAVLAVLPEGLPLTVLLDVAWEQGTIDSLLAKGWLRNVKGRLVPASGEIRRVLLEASSRDLTASVELVFLDEKADLLTREERAWLLLRNRETVGALEEGIWAARRAQERGDLRAAVELARTCFALARRLSAVRSGEEACLIAAQGLRLLGEYDEAAAQLNAGEYRSAASEQLLGLVQRARGDLDGARTHLWNAIALALESKNSTVFLQSSAELAEVEWRHGDQKARESALARLKEALNGPAGSDGRVDDRAALIYQLGAALVTTGMRSEGKEILEDGLALSPSDYWKMRIQNALGVAEYYLGNFEMALRWMEDAWGTAERGGFDSFKARIFSTRAAIHYGLGKFREAVEYHRLASMWATRSGERFEYLAACSGEAVNQMLLGSYEQALKCAREAHRAASEIGNEYEALKNLETEGACLALIGDYAGAKMVAGRVLKESREFGVSAVAPRALLLAGTLARVDGQWKDAVAFLEEAEKMLLETRDWEDLPIVQVELQSIRARDDSAGAIKEVVGIVREAARSGALIVQLRSCVVLGEILLASGSDHREHRDALTAGLGRAGEAGAAEEEWRLHHILAELNLRDGDRRAAAIRLAQATRVFRAIADRLSPGHRSCYLRTEHAKLLLSRAS